MQPKKFSEFAEAHIPLDGNKIKIDSVCGREIVIIGYKIKTSKYEKNSSGKCLTIQFEMEGIRHVVFTGSTVLIDQLEKYSEHLPFLTTIRKIDRFYTFT